MGVCKLELKLPWRFAMEERERVRVAGWFSEEDENDFFFMSFMSLISYLT